MLKASAVVDERVVFFLLGSLVLPGAVHQFRSLFKDFMSLEPQLEGFSCKGANCFCCTVGHVHPVTHASIPCDRMLVCNTLSKWFPVEPESIELGRTALDRFDEQVRAQFRLAFQTRGALSVPYQTAL